MLAVEKNNNNNLLKESIFHRFIAENQNGKR